MPTPLAITKAMAQVLLDLERLPPDERLVTAVDILANLDLVRTVRAGAVIDLRTGDTKRLPVTWASIGDLVGQSRQTVEQWAKQYR